MRTLSIISARLFVFGLLLALVSSCGKEGPAGAVGPAGSTGAAGPAGTANVIYGGWVNQNVVGYWYKTSNGYGWGSDFAAPITQDIIDKGVVLVYAKFAANSTTVYLLPSTLYGQTSVETYITLNRIYIQEVWNGAVGIPATYNTGLYFTQFRYVIIPGGTGGRKGVPTLDYSDYEAVKNYYNLPD